METRLHRIVDLVCAWRACTVFGIQTRSEKHQNAHTFRAPRFPKNDHRGKRVKFNRPTERDIYQRTFLSRIIEIRVAIFRKSRQLPIDLHARILKSPSDT